MPSQSESTEQQSDDQQAQAPVQPTAPAATPPDTIFRDWTKPLFRDTIPIQLERTKVRHMTMDAEMMDEVEAKMGVSLWEDDGWEKIVKNHKTIGQFLGIIFNREDPGVTTEQVLRMEGFKLWNMRYITRRLNEMWGAVMPPETMEEPSVGSPDGEPVPNVLTVPSLDSNGTSSGPTPVTTSGSRSKSSAG